MESKLTRSQFKIFEKSNLLMEDDGLVDIIVTVRFDDRCGNGHNTLSVTGNIYEAGRRTDRSLIKAGCCHDEIAKYFPELKEAIDYHLCSTEGPMYYIANSLHYARNNNLKYARSCAIWNNAELKDFTKENLELRLTVLLENLKRIINDLDMEY